jgi:hypothetical protein
VNDHERVGNNVRIRVKVLKYERSTENLAFYYKNNYCKINFEIFIKFHTQGGPQGDFKYLVLETHYHNPDVIKSNYFFTMFKILICRVTGKPRIWYLVVLKKNFKR